MASGRIAPALDPRGPRRARSGLPLLRILGNLTVLYTASWLLSLLATGVLVALGVRPAFPAWLDWLVGWIADLTIFGISSLVALSAVGLRLLHVAGRIALAALGIAAAVAITAGLLTVSALVPWGALASYGLGALVIIGVGLAVAGVSNFLLRDVEWSTGEARFSGWWDTSALDEDDEDPYDGLREGHPYDELAVLSARLRDAFPPHD